jgi:hypothetical protein
MRVQRPMGATMSPPVRAAIYAAVLVLLALAARAAVPTAALNATILHELGHVVDKAIAPDTLVARLDAKIPAGINCIRGRPSGSCAPVEERFADTFARWAMDDITINGTVGYRILPPVPIATWGDALVQFASVA